MASNKNLNERPGDRSNNAPKGDKPGGDGAPPSNKPSRGLLGLVAVIMIAVLSVLILTTSSRPANEISWKDFETYYNLKKFTNDTDSFRVTDTGLVAELKEPLTPGGSKTVQVVFNAPEREFYLTQLKELTGLNVKVERPTGVLTTVLLSWLPLLIILGLIWFVLIRGLRNAASGPGGMLGSFGKSRHKVLMREKTGITFNDVAGIDEAKSEVEEIVLFLKNPKRFTKLGGRIPRGVLLVGDPGCGKTLLARAIAGEADVPFFSISGSDFVEMFVGVGASRVRDLFKQAKENSPCIIFLDEIDAVGRRRGGGFSSGGHDEREQTLNAILVEMDGFTTTDGIIVVAATNRADVLDPALTRPGRFDRQIMVPLPDVKGRLEILKVHAKNKKLSPSVDFERLARATPMFSGADLMSLMNEAAIAATLQDKDFIEMEDLEEARDKVRYGRARKSRVREAEDTRLTAYHEAGHAVLNALLPHADPLHKVTIIPRGNFGGASFSLPEKDRHGYGAKYLAAHMRIGCGGRIAEERVSGEFSSGAAGDIASITGMARTMIEEWGMSPRLGFVRYAGEDKRNSYIPEKAFSDETAKIIDEEVKRLVDEAYADATRLLTDNWEKVVAVAEALIKYETLEANEVHKLMRGENLGKPTIRDLLAQEARKVPPALPAQPAKDGEPELPPGAMPTPA
ncbi:MAG TPA: ATP-dependent zinc metalloprotease FtsH [Phycisphaerales bacterium]|nr:ATP-dependent zinc metalloprotease FtsH [Phycisphaerales bacterium]